MDLQLKMQQKQLTRTQIIPKVTIEGLLLILLWENIRTLQQTLKELIFS